MKTYLLKLKSSALVITLLIPLALPLSASAQHETGNGGDPNELAEFTGVNGQHLESWYSVKQDLIKGMNTDTFRALAIGKISPDSFKTIMLKNLRAVKVQFDTQKIEINGVSRPCENFTGSNGDKKIHCNSISYVTAMKNFSSETQYKMIAHEYFSVSGFEPNEYGISSYPISSQISKSLRDVLVKKWAVDEAGDFLVKTGKAIILPELHVIKSFHFVKPYGCTGTTDKTDGYDTSALFLSSYSKGKNSPELLYNGTCQKNETFDVNMHGGNFSLITDLGDVPLQDVSASKSMNWSNINGKDNTFKISANALINHTYAVLYTSGDIKALYAFKLTSLTEDSISPATIDYAVLQYQVNTSTQESTGFDWEMGNH